MGNTIRNKNTIITLLLFIVVFFSLVFFEIIHTHHYRDKYRSQTINTFKDLKFKGKIISIKQYDCGGRIYGIMCAKLNYCNVDSFYVFNDMVCLKISDGIATFPTNCIHPNDTFDKRSIAILNAVDVMVNMNNDCRITYTDISGNQFSEDLDFPSRTFDEEMFNGAYYDCINK